MIDTSFPSAWLRDLTLDTDALPKGWMSTHDLRVLYSTAAVAQGPILEIGSWIGRSTCTMAYAIRDNVEAGLAAQRFDVVDFGIAGLKEARERFPAFEPITGPFADHHAEVLCFPGGVPGLLKQNLVSRDLSRYMNHLIFGRFTTYEPATRYHVAFCDAAHNNAEISENVPHLASMLDSDDFLVVLDDVDTLEAANAVLDFLSAERASIGPPTSKLMIATKGKYSDLVFAGSENASVLYNGEFAT